MISLCLFNKFQFVTDNSRRPHLQITWAYEREMVNTLLKWPISLRINDKIILAQGYKDLHNFILLQEQCFYFNFSKICMRCVCGIFLFFSHKISENSCRSTWSFSPRHFLWLWYIFLTMTETTELALFWSLHRSLRGIKIKTESIWLKKSPCLTFTHRLTAWKNSLMRSKLRSNMDSLDPS